MRSVLSDDSGAMEIPLRLVVYVILTAVILAIAIIGLSNLKPGMTTDTMEKQIGIIKVSLNAMQYGSARNLIDPASPAGNLRTFNINLPEDIEYLAFGVDPDPDNNGNLTDTKENLITERGNVIFYKSWKGSKIRVPLEENIELREGLFDRGRWILNNANGKQYGIVLRGNGKFSITFELVYDTGSKERYTLAHHIDNFNAYIDPYDPAALANSVWVSVYPNSIPSDGVTRASAIVQLKDRKGRDAPGAVVVNLTATFGNLSSRNLTTVKGRAATDIVSGLPGIAVITASSIGLNPGSTYLKFKQVPIILDIKKWINETAPFIIPFTTVHDLNYSLSLAGSGTEALWEWPNASIEIDGVPVGEETVDSPTLITRTFSQVTLPAGDHNMSIKMTNDLFIPLIADRNLYVESITLSEP